MVQDVRGKLADLEWRQRGVRHTQPSQVYCIEMLWTP